MTSVSCYKCRKEVEEPRQPCKNCGSSPEQPAERKVSTKLGFGIAFMPVIFYWFLLRKGYSKRARIIGFIFLVIFVWSMCNKIDRALEIINAPSPYHVQSADQLYRN
ncbi:hypothetical protein [Pantoea sp. A4]|uniref:hypothetical protein n=1 Tax=Pantoea sp. A4 TaxID=1225184 RepID=UPI00036DF9C6|nr:hypothetical protein [Pantoea sp. A4]